MSHFTALVIGDNPKELLAPYDENMDVEPYREEVERKELERMVDYYTSHEEESKRIKGLDINDPTTLQPYWSAWGGAELLIDENGESYRMSTYNPRSQWDWYELGGRWQGMLRLNHGEDGVTGRASTLFKKHEYIAAKVDRASVAAIDWAYMRNDPEDLLHLVLRWEEAARGESFYKPGYYEEKYADKQEFLRRNMQFNTFAVITADGEWHEVGKMGWWGMSSETTDDDRAWSENYWEAFLEGLDPETPISVYDLHI